jgi:hypothetical protein
LVDCCKELLANKGSIFFGKRSQTGAVEDHDEDNQSASIGKGELRVLGAFRDLSESIGSRNGKGDSGSLISIKFELDFHSSEQKNGPEPETAADKSRYEEDSIDGKQYLEYL